jgi:hypothetical protein
MASISKKAADRLSAGIKRFQPILSSAKTRDVNESDTAIIVTDMLSEVFGFDKYSEVTSEFAIRGTACDLAIKLDGTVEILLEIKASGLELKDAHVKQAVDYAANQGLDWTVLTNGIVWKIYKVLFNKPIEQELVAEFDFLTLNSKDDEHLGLLHLLSKEGWTKSVLDDFHSQKQALSRFSIAALVLSDPVASTIRRELRRLSPDVKVDIDQLRSVLTPEVLKRDVLEGEKADDAKRKVNRSLNKTSRPSRTEPAPSIDPEAVRPASTADVASTNPEQPKVGI